MLIYGFDNLTFGYRLRAEYAFLVIGKSGKYLIRAVVDEANEGNPFFLVVLESNHIGFQFNRTLQYMLLVGNIMPFLCLALC